MLQRRTPLKRTAFKPRIPQQIARDLTAKLVALRRPVDAPRGVIAPVSSGVAAIPKQPRERNQHLLDMAKDRPCLFWFVDGCKGAFDTSTTVKAHDNRLSSNKGKGYKAHDWCSVDACEPCHTAYDQGNKHTREEKDAAFDAAFQRQLQTYRDTVANPFARPKDREAARWAIQRYEFHKGDHA